METPSRSRFGYGLSVLQASPTHLAVNDELMSIDPLGPVTVILRVPLTCSGSTASKRRVPVDFRSFRLHSTWISCIAPVDVTKVLVQALSPFPKVRGLSSFSFLIQVLRTILRPLRDLV